MSRKSRRKTLSHAEIENFLCDLGNDTETMKSSAIDTVVAITEPSSSSDSENQEADNFSSCSILNKEDDDKCYRAKIVRAFHKVIQQSPCNHSIIIT